MAQYSDAETLEVTFTPDPALQNHAGAKHVCIKTDSFSFKGPNGTHLCLVFKPLGRSFEEVIDSASRCARDPTYNPGKYGTRNWPTIFAREACYQLVLSLDYLHSQGIMHRDIQPGNIHLDLTYDLDALTKDEIQHDVWDDDDEASKGNQNTMSASAWADMNFSRQSDYINMIERSDGEPLTENDPHYTVAGISLHDRLKIGSDPPAEFSVQLIDLGAACKIEDCNDDTTPYPLDVRAPEVVLKLPYTEKADIWALACTIFRIVSLEPLVPLWVTLDKEATDDEHMKCLIDRFGKLPDDIRSKWARANQHIDEKGDIIDPDPYQSDSPQFGDLWQGVRLAKPKDMSEDESRVFYDLLKKMLDYDPRKRLSTKEVLEHPWFHM